MTVSPEAVEALRRAAATKPDVARLVLIERTVSPRSEEPFTEVRLVVVLDEPPLDPEAAFEPVREAARLFVPALEGLSGCSIHVPTAAGAEAAGHEGRVVYERDTP